jgi:hypothetical protein
MSDFGRGNIGLDGIFALVVAIGLIVFMIVLAII